MINDAMIYTMKKSISITVEEELLLKIGALCEGETRSRVVERALESWILNKERDALKKDAKQLLDFMQDGYNYEQECLEDGLDEIQAW